MFDHTLLAFSLGLFLGTNLGVIVMALMAIAKRFDTVEVGSER